MLFLEAIIKQLGEKPSKIKGFDKTLIIGGCDFKYYKDNTTHYGREARLLANNISRRGIDVLISNLAWPRDGLLFFEDGRFMAVDNGTAWTDLYDHEAFHQGKILKGDGFIICSDSVNPEKREKTEAVLGVDEGFYYDISSCLEMMSKVVVSRKRDFYNNKGHRHIDYLFNIANKEKLICTYDHDMLLDFAMQMSKETGYKIRILPFNEAKYGSIGFQELGDHVVVDRRARETMKILETAGYDIIKTPRPMRETNRQGGTVRCRCIEMPIPIDKIEFYSFKGDGRYQVDLSTSLKAEQSPIQNLEGYKAVVPHIRNKIKLKKTVFIS